jgi:hypothetical protein
LLENDTLRDEELKSWVLHQLKRRNRLNKLQQALINAIKADSLVQISSQQPTEKLCVKSPPKRESDCEQSSDSDYSEDIDIENDDEYDTAKKYIKQLRQFQVNTISFVYNKFS